LRSLTQELKKDCENNLRQAASDVEHQVKVFEVKLTQNREMLVKKFSKREEYLKKQLSGLQNEKKEFSTSVELLEISKREAETAYEGEIQGLYAKLRETEEKLVKTQEDFHVYRGRSKNALKRSTADQKSAQDAEAKLKSELESTRQKNTDLSNQLAELESKREEIKENELQRLKGDNESLTKQMEDLVSKLNKEAVSYKKEILGMKENSEEKIKQLSEQLEKQKTKYEGENQELRRDIKSRNERARQLIQEKDKEIVALRKHNQKQLEEDRRISLEAEEAKKKESGSETQLLKLAQQQAKRDSQVKTLQQTISKLKADLSETCSALEEKSIENTSLVEKLEEHLQKQNPDVSFNLEYLKNVTYSYLDSTNSEEKTQLLRVISTILNFTDEEQLALREKIEKKPSGSFWGSNIF